MGRTLDWDGKTGASWAAEWRRTDRSFGGLTERLLAKTREFHFSNVLDIGCGAGELSLAIARGRHNVQVLGLDISPQLIEAAHGRGQNLSNASFELGNAATWSSAEGFTPDLLVSRHGVMFFSDPVGAFTHLAAIAAPDAGLLFSCFRSPRENEIFSGIANLLPPPETPPDSLAPGPLAFADPERVRAILTEAGWGAINFEPVDFAMVVGAGVDPVEDAMGYFRHIGAAATVLAEMPEPEQNAFEERLRAYVTSREMDGIVALGAAAWIVTAQRG